MQLLLAFRHKNKKKGSFGGLEMSAAISTVGNIGIPVKLLYEGYITSYSYLFLK